MHASPFGFHLICTTSAPISYIVTISILTCIHSLHSLVLLVQILRIWASTQELRRIWNENHTEDPANVPANEDQASNDDDKGIESGMLPEALAYCPQHDV